jgi:hypothetical protein
MEHATAIDTHFFHHPSKETESASSSRSASLEHAPGEYRESEKHNVAEQVTLRSSFDPVSLVTSLSGTIPRGGGCHWPVAQRAGTLGSGETRPKRRDPSV